jgi:formate/nitrite transporter FocA (FNT family)
LSALLTNLLVAGGVICYNATDNKAVGIVALIMCIATFVIAGFNHVVANMYFSIISLLATGKCNFLTLILLAFIGNVLSGYFLVFAFYFINKSGTKKYTIN